MKYEDPQLIEMLAADYVVGTMTGQARARFKRLMATSPDVRRAVWQRERELQPLALSTEPEAPDAAVWSRIEQQLFEDTHSKSRRVGWRFWSVTATAAALMMAVAIVWLPVTKEPTHFAQFNDDTAQPMWIISADLDAGRLRARAVNVQAVEIDKVFELWMLPEGGSPRSLGLLPVGSEPESLAIPAGLAALLSRTPGLAISIEPAGGSPTGLPTGPVVYQANWIRL